MTEFIITEIGNGWLLQGPSDTPDMTTSKQIFLPTIHAVADILTTWQIQGFIKAMGRAREKYDGAKWQ